MWRVSILAAVLLSPSADAARGIPVTEVYAGPPPQRYMIGGRQAVVSFDTLDVCGTPPEGKVFIGCRRGNLLHVPNPCNFQNEQFARTMCHEMAHLNGWSRKHGP